LEALLTPKAMDSFVVHCPACLPKFCVNESVTVTGMLANELVHLCYQTLLLGCVDLGPVTLRATRLPQGSTCPTLRHAQLLLDVLDRLSTPRRA
jgi:hypothetical protein